MLLLLLLLIPAQEVKAHEREGEINVNELVFGHIGDSYEWGYRHLRRKITPYSAARHREELYRMACVQFLPA